MDVVWPRVFRWFYIGVCIRFVRGVLVESKGKAGGFEAYWEDA